MGFPGDRYVVVEVKNSKRTDTRYQAQAGRYMEASSLLGALILLERKTGDTVELVPLDTDRIIDGIVMYPRLSKVKKAHTLEVTIETATRIMKTKYLAIKDNIPADANTGYCSRCRYRELCKTLQEDQLVDIDSVSMLIQLPVTAAVELSERHGVDLDMLFYGNISTSYTRTFRQCSEGEVYGFHHYRS